MPIHQLLENTGFDPERVKEITTAFDDVCRTLGLSTHRDDLIRRLVARRVFDVAMRGARDARLIADLTIKQIKEA